MEEIINNVFLTSILVFVLVIIFIKLRGEFETNEIKVGDTEKYISVVMLFFSAITGVVSAFCLIWI